MYPIQVGNTAVPLLFMLVSALDHLSPVTGQTPAPVLSANGAAFAAPNGAITEIGDGWYKIAANALDAATLGPLLLHVPGHTGSPGYDPQDIIFEVVNFDPLNLPSFIWNYAGGRTITGGPSVIVVANPVAPSGTVTIRQGYVYSNEYGTALSFQITGATNLSTADLQLYDIANQEAVGTASLINTSGSVQTIAVELTAQESQALPAGQRSYALTANFGVGPLDLGEGTLNVLGAQ